MGGQLLEGEGIHEGDDRAESKDDQDICQDIGGAQEENGQKRSLEERNLVDVLSTTVGHFFPDFNDRLASLGDPRNQDMIIYRRETLLWSGLIMMLTKQGARSKVGNEMRGNNFLENLKQLSGQDDLETAPHGDTLEYLFRQMGPDEFEEKVQVPLINQLIRGRVLENDRLMIRSKQGGGQMDKYYMVATDGVHTHSFDYEHCSGCLVKTHENGTKTWMHKKLQASLVTESGLCLPMCSEWIENEKEYEKQNCEIKTFYRLIRKIRKYYPQLKICMILDSLYAEVPVMEALKEARIESMIVFKEGSMLGVWKYKEWCKEQLHVEKELIEQEEKVIEKREARSHEQRLIRTRPKNEQRKVIRTLRYGWINQLEHSDRKRIFNMLSCKDEKTAGKYAITHGLLATGLTYVKKQSSRYQKAGGVDGSLKTREITYKSMGDIDWNICILRMKSA